MPRLTNAAAALAFFIAGASTPPLAAKATKAQVQTAWKVYESLDACSVSGMSGRAFVFLPINPEGEQGIRIHHPDIKIAEGEMRQATLTIGDVRLDLTVIGARTSDGMPGFTADGPQGLRAALVAGTTATLAVSSGANLALDLTELAEVLPLRDRCAARLKPRDPDSIVAVRPKLIRMPAINPSDIELERASQRRVSFQLTISREGTAEKCEITSSSGFERLDTKICRLLIAGARFTPARNAADQQIIATYTSGVVF